MKIFQYLTLQKILNMNFFIFYQKLRYKILLFSHFNKIFGLFNIQNQILGKEKSFSNRREKQKF